MIDDVEILEKREIRRGEMPWVIMGHHLIGKNLKKEI